MIYWDLFLGFLKVGCFTFGGAYSAIPLIRDVVRSYGWLSDETLTFMIRKVINDGYTLKSLTTGQKDIEVIDSILQILEEQQKKMISVQSGIKEIGRVL